MSEGLKAIIFLVALVCSTLCSFFAGYYRGKARAMGEAAKMIRTRFIR